MGADEFGSGTDDVVAVLLVGVHSREGIKETEVNSTVGDDTNNGNTDTVVQSSHTSRGDGLFDAVGKAVELLLSTSDIGGETCTSVVKGVNDGEGSGSSKTTRGHVDSEELGKLGVLVCLGEEGLNSVLEGEVEGLGGEITDDVGEVSTPEGANALLAGYTGEAVNDAGVTGDLSGDNFGVGILGLDEELDTLDGGGAGLGHGSGDTAGKEVYYEIAHCDGVVERSKN